jgi:hypothetical protein
MMPGVHLDEAWILQPIYWEICFVLQRRVKAHVLQMILLPALFLFYVQNFTILPAA